MPRVIARVESEVLVDHRSFDLLDDGGPQRAEPNFATTTQWMFAGDNAISVVSAASDHVARVTVEAWDGPPPPADGWPYTQTAVVRLDSGLVEINPLVEGEDADYLDVGGPGTYHVAAYAAGRDETAALDPPPEVERYLFQFWR